ncbi:neurotrophin receptor-interacting factor 1-like isoform X4 [Ylistrum balloti]|uniref:neurotrophin receptor-interacting factor 1-like isoform X4 n=1 Tax=Ylistrum balloti TaxID=509963 RepID=UPI0029057FFE|nr:neurotrophin receptor-interacting factor 1-like isoform X4 [Ylistrum balloti]XP_060086261.1 neurotrophin receptor-interacting factor 1-like isoform X4 [Ylistrum balloti]
MNYQKFYTNGIHSSSLLCQLATMWKSQTLCDAIIKTGSINTKAHRLVLVAACPMLQSMDNASIGSHLEVRLASEIKQDSVNMFLQYLYEGFMMLTEDNHKDIEKIARLLQVDSVIKCCADFCKSLHEKTGLSVYSAGQYKYSSHDMLEFKHVRVSGIQKTVQDSMMKRHSDFQRPNSPGSKRPRMHRPGSPSDGQRGDNMYGHSSHSDSDRVPRLGLGSFPGAAGRNLQPGVVEVIEDSLELVQTEPVERDPVTGRPIDSRPPVQKTVAISVASQVTGGDPDLQIVNVSGVKDGTSSSSSTSRAQLSTATHTTSTPIARDSRGSFMHSSFSSQQSSQSMRSDIPMPSLSRASSDRTMSQMPRSDIQRSMQNQFSSEPQQQQQKQSSSQYPSIPQALIDMDFTAAKQKSDVFPTSLQKATDAFPTNLPKPSDVVFPGMQMSSQQNNTQQSKPFAAGSAGQVNQSVPVHINTSSSSSSPITSLPPVSPVIPDTSFSLSASPNSKSQPSTSRSESVERPGSGERMKEERPPTVDLVGPDISIVKIESTDKDETGALDMYVDTGDDGEVHPHGMEGDGEQTYEGGSDYDVEEPPGEMEGSNEGSNLSGDQNAWYLNTMKGPAHSTWDSRVDLSMTSVDLSLTSEQDQSQLCKQYVCLHCSDLFSSKKKLQIHKKVHMSIGQMGFKCKPCGLTFTEKRKSAEHQMIVHGCGFIGFCKHCGKSFYSGWGLNLHERMHDSSNDSTKCASCDVCGRKFQTEAHLLRHQKSHSTIRPFYCGVCGKSYKHREGLIGHACRPIPNVSEDSQAVYMDDNKQLNDGSQF